MDGEDEDEDDDDDDDENPVMASSRTPLKILSDEELSISTSYSSSSSLSSSLMYTRNGDRISVPSASKLPTLDPPPPPIPPPVSGLDSVEEKQRCLAMDCTVSLAADCTAICCCCPLCFLQLAFLAFVKLPLAVATRVITAAKRKRKKLKMMMKKKCNSSSNGSHEVRVTDDSPGRIWSFRRSPLVVKGPLSPAWELDHQQLWTHFGLSHSAGFGIRQQDRSD